MVSLNKALLGPYFLGGVALGGGGGTLDSHDIMCLLKIKSEIHPSRMKIHPSRVRFTKMASGQLQIAPPFDFSLGDVYLGARIKFFHIFVSGIFIWEWCGNSMGPAYHKGVPLLGVPGITLDIVLKKRFEIAADPSPNTVV